MAYLGPLFLPYAGNLRQQIASPGGPSAAQPAPLPGQEVGAGITYLGPSRANPDVRAAEMRGDTNQSRSFPQALFGRLEQGIQSPLFMAGLGLMANGPGGMMEGIKAGSSMRTLPLERAMKEAQINEAVARTGYYNRRTQGGGGAGYSATERMIDKLRDEDPDLSYGDAVTRVRRAPSDDTLARERLAVQASRNDPSKTLEEWRSFYGLSQPNTQPPPPRALFETDSPSQGGGGQPGTKANPIVPKSQSEIDAAPRGTVFSIDGQLMVK